MLFTELGLKEDTLKGVLDVGYETPTPIQQQVIPHVLGRRDVFGCAQTGTGKTASFTLPLLDILKEGRARAKMPRLLVLVPTRELAHQVAESFAKYGKYHKFNLALMIGGESIYEQERKLIQGMDILIATPGRLLDLFDRGKIMLHAIEVVVIDEADRMLDMGFIPDVEKIFSFVPRKRQTLMFSATVSSEVKRLSQTFLHDFVEVTVSRPSKAADTIKHYFVRIAAKNKTKTLRHIIEKESIKSAIVFCNRKKDISTVCTSLKRQGYQAAPLHGDLHQEKRKETLGAFKQGQIPFLVASDVAARGLDVEELDFVFNFDVPLNADEYVHRIGRTGRAGRSGQAFTLVAPEDHLLVKAIEKLLKVTVMGYPLDLEEESAPQKTVVKKPAPSVERKKETSEGREKRVHVQKISSRGPVMGFGDEPPAFIKNYFPHLEPGTSARSS